MSTFASVRLSLEQYYSVLVHRGMSERAQHLLQEVRGRLRQLQWMHERLLTLETALLAEAFGTEESAATRQLLVFAETGMPVPGTLVQAFPPSRPEDEMRVLLEGFYYFADRVRDVFATTKVSCLECRRLSLGAFAMCVTTLSSIQRGSQGLLFRVCSVADPLARS